MHSQYGFVTPADAVTHTEAFSCGFSSAKKTKPFANKKCMKSYSRLAVPTGANGVFTRLLLTMVLAMGASFSAEAALNCSNRTPWLDMFSGTYGGFFAFPDDAATLPIGARVGAMREVNLRYRCTGMLSAEKFGTGMKAASGIIYDAATQTYTTPQLSALGLGYRMWWHEPVGGEAHNPTTHPNSNPTINYPPVNWYSRPSSGFDLKISTRVIFFKINNNFQNTNGNGISININTNLFTFYVAEQSAPDTPRGDQQPYMLNFKRFASMQRVCTPLLDKTIKLATMSAEDMPQTGVVASSSKTFSLHFKCPYMAYYMVGFKLESQHGVLDADNGVFGIEQGPGYAQGVGVQFQAPNLATSWRANQNYTSPWQVLKPGQNYSIPWFEYTTSDNNMNPATSQREREVNFKVAYYRMPGALVGGKVKSRVVVRLVYQ